MNGYDAESVVRSVRRYLSLMLGQPWNLALERVEVRDDARPAGVVEMGEVRQRRARVSVPQGEREEFAPVTVTLYPALADARQAGRDARLLRQRLWDLVVIGPDARGEPSLFRDGEVMAGPERLPLWDYSETPIGTAGPSTPIDVLWAEDFSARAIQDPLDARRWSVILEVRISWEREGRVPPDGVKLDRVIGTGSFL